VSTDHRLDLPHADALLGHSNDEVRWLLQHAVRGTPDHPHLTPEEYEQFLPELERWRRDQV